MMDDLTKMDVQTIDLHIDEFRRIASDRERGRISLQSTRRFYARGAYLSALRDALDERLRKGWLYINNNPSDVKAADLWFDLLERYESICDVLSRYSNVTREEAARIIFKGVEHGES